jgi:hypothetical protein
MPLDRDVYFDAVRAKPFGGHLDQDQVDGQNLVLDYFEDAWVPKGKDDLRWLAYILATDKWETAHTMQPIEEYEHGKGKPYGVEDPETKQTYYGRGLVQLTWRDNYAKATKNLALTGEDDLEWHAAKALEPDIATAIIFEGMAGGWFTGKKLDQYFNDTKDDATNARQIVNGNDHDDDIAAIHEEFLAALDAAWTAPAPEPEAVVTIAITAPAGVAVKVTVNGDAMVV